MRAADGARWRTRATMAAGAAVAAGVLAAGGLSLARGERAASLSATCVDPAGDLRDVATGRPPPAPVAGTDLRRVDLRVGGGQLTVRFATLQPVPRTGADLPAGVTAPFQWVVWLMDGDDVAYHLRAVLRPDGWQLVRDDLRGEPVVTVEPPALDGRELAWSVALDDLPRLPASFGWVALTTHGTPSVQDVCPDAAADSLDPAVQVPFPGTD